MAEGDRRHVLPGFDRALETLRGDLIVMATLVQRTFSNMKAGFIGRDNDLCAAVIADDEEIDILEKQIDRAGTEILQRFQPMIFDLRTVLATIKAAAHLERISDHAGVIARRIRRLNEEDEVPDADLLRPLFDETEKWLREGVEAFLEADSGRSERVRAAMEPLAQRARDVDEQFTDIVEERFQLARGYVNLIEIAQSLEKIVYRIENVVEDAVYIAEARDVRHSDNKLEI
jgi:phosphate transport system protein